MARRCSVVLLTFLLLLDGGLLVGQQKPSTQTDRDLTLAGGRRLALIVGNDGYKRAPLLNARNDARAMAVALSELGFAVTALENTTRNQFVEAVSKFGEGLRATDVAWFFFAGHGLQVGGENYLVPVDFTGTSQTDVRLRTLPVSELQKAFSSAQVSVVVLDACRNNPFLGARSGGQGLAPIDAQGSLIAFATGAGQTASDNNVSGNGLFTQELLRVIREPDLGVRDMFFRVRQRVLEASSGQQFPAVFDGLIGDLTMRTATATAEAAPRPADQQIRPTPIARPPTSASKPGGRAIKWLFAGGAAAAGAAVAMSISRTGDGAQGTAPQASTSTNRPPTITSVSVNPAGAHLGSGTTSIFEVIASDPDGDPMTAVWGNSPPTPFTLVSGRAVIRLGFNAGMAGVINQTVTVSDGKSSTTEIYPPLTIRNVVGAWTGVVGQSSCSPPSSNCFTFRLSLAQLNSSVTGDYDDQFGRTSRVTGRVSDERGLSFSVTLAPNSVAGAGGIMDFILTGNGALTSFAGLGGTSPVTITR